MKLTSKRVVAQTVTGIVITMVMLGWQFLPLGPISEVLNRLDGIIYDLRLKELPPWPESIANIQIVDIDENSLHAIGRMPWPRAKFAQLTQKLTDMGAVTIAFDILFTEPEVNPAERVIAHLAKTSDKNAVRAIAAELDGDGMLASSFMTNEVVLANLFHHESNIQKGALKPSPVVQKLTTTRDSLYRFSGYSANTDKLARFATGQGFVNVVPDIDGFVRRSPLVIVNGENIYPSLALDTFRVYSLIDEITLEWHSEQKAFLSGINIGQSKIPTDNKGNLLIPFRESAFHYPYTSAAEVMMGKVADDRFDNAVVFVGTSATGLADLKATPVGINYPGVEIHATIFDALLMPTYLPSRPDWWKGAVLIKIIVIALTLLLFLPRLGAITSEIFVASLLLVVVGSNFFAWQQYAVDLPLMSSALLTIVLAGYFIGYGYLSENNRRKQVKKAFERYVSPEHIDEMLEQPSSLNLVGQKKQLTVMFSDIRDFTAISESLTPEQLSSWLNAVFSPLTRDIFSQQGTIDKYVGDMVMAFWGAPLEVKNQASNAVTAAIRMQESIDSLNAVFRQNNLPCVEVGIGINTGMMNVGDMGSNYRLSYTVLGDAVNLGSRIESLTKFYGVNILLSEFTRMAMIEESESNWSTEDFIVVDKVSVKGRVEPVVLYVPILPNVSTDEREQCQIFNEAMQAYFERQFKQANAKLQAINKGFRHQTLKAIYRQRVKAYLAEVPSDGWDGVFIHKQK